MIKTKKTKRGKRRATAKVTPAATGSVISAEYRKKHQPDEFAQRLKKHVAGNDGNIDLTKLRRLAEQNDVWQSKWANLNSGMQFMGLSNCLRALVRRGGKVEWERS
jgi:hypothetical protein